MGRKSLPLHCPLRSCSWSSERLKVRLIALRCLVVAHFIAVSAVSAQDPATVGQFSSVMTWPYKTVHAHLLPTGKVLYWGHYVGGPSPQLCNPSTITNTAA